MISIPSWSRTAVAIRNPGLRPFAIDVPRISRFEPARRNQRFTKQAMPIFSQPLSPARWCKPQALGAPHGRAGETPAVPVRLLARFVLFRARLLGRAQSL